MIHKILISILMISVLLAGGCMVLPPEPLADIPEREVAKKISPQDAGFGGWEFVENQYADSQPIVSYEPLKEKPSIHWKKSIHNWVETNTSNLLIDRNGCIWYSPSDMNSLSSKTEIMKFNPDGSNVKIATMNCFTVIWPILAMSDAVVFQGKNTGDDLSAIMCYSLSGEFLWRSEKFRFPDFGSQAKRITGNRIILPVDENDRGLFAIFSLLDGERLDTLHFENWSGIIATQVPTELPTGDWLGFEKSHIVRYNKDLDPIWKYSFVKDPSDTNGTHFYPIISLATNTAMIGKVFEYVAIDLDTGLEKWKIEDIGNVSPTNLTGTNGTIVFGNLLSPEKIPFRNYIKSDGEGGYVVSMDIMNKVMCFGPDGDGIWAVPENDMSPFPMSKPVCYTDGSVLFASAIGLTMVSADGAILWRISRDEFGVKSGTDMWDFKILPTPDNRIVASVRNSGVLNSTMKIYSLGLP